MRVDTATAEDLATAGGRPGKNLKKGTGPHTGPVRTEGEHADTSCPGPHGTPAGPRGAPRLAGAAHGHGTRHARLRGHGTGYARARAVRLLLPGPALGKTLTVHPGP